MGLVWSDQRLLDSKEVLGNLLGKKYVLFDSEYFWVKLKFFFISNIPLSVGFFDQYNHLKNDARIQFLSRFSTCRKNRLISPALGCSSMFRYDLPFRTSALLWRKPMSLNNLVTQHASAWLCLDHLGLAWLSMTQHDSAWLSMTQLNSAHLSLSQLVSARLNSTRLDSARLG